MRALLIAVAGVLLFACGPDLVEDQQAATVAQPLEVLDVPLPMHPELKSEAELFGVNPTLDPTRQTFQQHFAYTVDVPH